MCGRAAAARLGRWACHLISCEGETPVPERPIVVFDVNETLLNLDGAAGARPHCGRERSAGRAAWPHDAQLRRAACPAGAARPHRRLPARRPGQGRAALTARGLRSSKVPVSSVHGCRGNRARLIQGVLSPLRDGVCPNVGIADKIHRDVWPAAAHSAALIYLVKVTENARDRIQPLQ
jgi:hypothetical protein